MNTVESRTESAEGARQRIQIRAHTIAADLDEVDTAPGAHDYFDAALAACKSLTAHWYASRNGIPLERVETRIERDDSQERAGTYRLRVHIAFHGALSDEQRANLHRVVAKCPIHKLMTKTEIEIETVEA